MRTFWDNHLIDNPYRSVPRTDYPMPLQAVRTEEGFRVELFFDCGNSAGVFVGKHPSDIARNIYEWLRDRGFRRQASHSDWYWDVLEACRKA